MEKNEHAKDTKHNKNGAKDIPSLNEVERVKKNVPTLYAPQPFDANNETHLIVIVSFPLIVWPTAIYQYGVQRKTIVVEIKRTKTNPKLVEP